MLFETQFDKVVPLALIGALGMVTAIAFGLMRFKWQAQRRHRICKDTALDRLRRNGI